VPFQIGLCSIFGPELNKVGLGEGPEAISLRQASTSSEDPRNNHESS
jgi:hypothetical protein